MHHNSLLIFKKYAAVHFQENAKVLEIGAAGFPSEYAKLVKHTSMEWHTLDIGEEFNNFSSRNPLHVVSKNEYSYPFPDNSFDVVLAGNVIEHVKEIWTWMDELARIAKPNGKVIIICPVSWVFHEAPVDCWRIYPDGMTTLMIRSGLSVLVSRFETLEPAHLPPYFPVLPGISTLPPTGRVSVVLRLKGFYNLVLSKIPVLKKFVIPITVAYDTIGIGEKVPSTSAVSSS
jgi:SAM-dependent methyltransferase